MIDLPAIAYATHPPDGRTVIIVRHESGFRDFTPAGPVADVDTLNSALGVSKAQAAAMLAGSMFGWDVPAARPESYDEAGKLRTTRLPPGTAHGLKPDTIGDVIYRQHGSSKS